MVQLLLKGKGIIQCRVEELAEYINELLHNDTLKLTMSGAGRNVIESQQGATKRYENLIVEHTPNA